MVKYHPEGKGKEERFSRTLKLIEEPDKKILVLINLNNFEKLSRNFSK